LADGYFVIPYALGDYIVSNELPAVDTSHAEFEKVEGEVDAKVQKLLSINGNKTVKEIHRALGLVMWEYVGMSREESGLKKAIGDIQALRAEFWSNVKVVGTGDTLNKNLEFAGRVADFLELGELMAADALYRAESCGGHFRLESQTEDHEAKRDDENFAHVAAWEFKGDGAEPALHKEELTFENVPLTTRSYK
ncbi:MAG: fumarate reductase/succinate dehydrogenase flavoprotein subunit, partial [Candidatus Krumholzibacteria bacterium]|nr:fumarate reductase/succinate dehydrogenase flavoprotein subunit [Candidatus Krumholzibacteria bacterium]